MATGRRLAVCIGINDYPGTGSDLRGCVNDAMDWAAELRDRQFEVQTLLDQQATGRAIKDALRSLARQARPGDLVVVTYSGHGSYVQDLDGDEEDGWDECWCPHDPSHAVITDDELHAIHGERADGVRWILISDSCHSGTVARFAPIHTPPTVAGTSSRGASPQRLVRFLPPSQFVQGLEDHLDVRSRISSPPGRSGALLLSGCQDAEYSWDAWFEGRSNGAFTFVALRALREMEASGGPRSYAAWYEAIRRLLPSQQYAQTPNLFGPEWMSHWEVFRTEAEDGLPSSAADTGPTSAPSARAEQDEECDCPGSTPKQARKRGRRIAKRILALRDQERAESAGVKDRRDRDIPLVAEGDSWFDYPFNDVLGCLEDRHGYSIDSVAKKGHTVEDMAYSGGQLAEFVRLIDRQIDRGIAPRGVLLSGGGNDVAGDEFAQLLNHSDSGLRGLDEHIVRGVLRRLRDAYETIITSVSTVCERRLGRELPIVLHGYDYAVPDGRGYELLITWSGPWLLPALKAKGYRHAAERMRLVAELIDRFNELQVDVVRQFDHVHHVDLRNTLPNGTGYKKWWHNELHPTKRGYRRVASHFDRVIRQALRT